MPAPTLEQLLQEAQAAQHQLMTGTSVVEVKDSNGETVRYTPANAFRLAAYITDLRRQLGQVSSGPLQVYF